MWRWLYLYDSDRPAERDGSGYDGAEFVVSSPQDELYDHLFIRSKLSERAVMEETYLCSSLIFGIEARSSSGPFCVVLIRVRVNNAGSLP